LIKGKEMISYVAISGNTAGRRWQLSIDEQRIQFNKALKDTPGLKPALDEIIKYAYKLAVIKAAQETKISKGIFPECCPWTLTQLMDEAFYPD